jgi:hypothetical protein
MQKILLRSFEGYNMLNNGASFIKQMVDKFDCWESSVPENLQEINLSKNV